MKKIFIISTSDGYLIVDEKEYLEAANYAVSVKGGICHIELFPVVYVEENIEYNVKMEETFFVESVVRKYNLFIQGEVSFFIDKTMKESL